MEIMLKAMCFWAVMHTSAVRAEAKQPNNGSRIASRTGYTTIPGCNHQSGLEVPLTLLCDKH